MALPEFLVPKFVGDDLPAALNEERDAINALTDEVEKKITMPGGAATGDMLRWDGTQWLTTETRFFEGNGSPNGVIAAPVGSRYVDKLATKGAVEWVKVSGGESNLGWTSAVGNYPILGQAGSSSVTGAAGATKTIVVQLNPAIFGGVAPRQILTQAHDSYGDVTHSYPTGKTATQFTLGVRRIDGGAYPAATGVPVDWLAII